MDPGVLTTALPLHLVGPFLATFVRAAAVLQAAPLTGDRMLAPRARVAAAALLALTLGPLRPPLALPDLPLALPAELVVGLAVGFAARLMLAGVEAGGQLIGLLVGLGFAGSYDPSAGEESLATRRLAATLGALAFLVCDGLSALVHAIALPVPALAGPGSPIGATILARLVDGGAEVLVVAVRLAAPFVLAALVTHAAAALASRAAPALNVFSVTFALLIAIGVALLVHTAPPFVRQTMTVAQRAAAAPVLLLGGPR